RPVVGWWGIVRCPTVVRVAIVRCPTVITVAVDRTMPPMTWRSVPVAPVTVARLGVCTQGDKGQSRDGSNHRGPTQLGIRDVAHGNLLCSWITPADIRQVASDCGRGGEFAVS